MKLTEFTLLQLASMLREKEITSVELTEAYLQKIESTEPTVGAFISVNGEQALARAASCDSLLAKGDAPASPLYGIPMALKDNLCTVGVRTTCASKMLEHYTPIYNATAAEKLFSAGAVMLGKLNMDEFAMGSSTENSAFHLTRNPRRFDCVPGGSSGGSAAAVAAGEAAYTLGSDTGGSIRQPAAFCGVVGMKPTYGSVSRYGLVAFASSLDQIGPLTRTVKENALVLDAICGYDPMDATSVDRTYASALSTIERGVDGLKIAIPREFFGEGISAPVKEKLLDSMKTYEKHGAKVEWVSMPSLKYALSAYYVISSAEASSNLARFDGIRYGYRAEGYTDLDDLYKKSRSEAFGAEVKRRILLGTFALSAGYYDAYYKKAQQVRALIRKEYADIFAKFDLILSPVAPTVAYKLGEKSSDPLEMYMGDMYTVPVNIAGNPALSLPAGFCDDGLPVGMQLIGPAFSEALLYQAAFAYESIGKSFKEVRA